MPNWKKIIVSGSDAVLNNVTASGAVISGSLHVSGNILPDSDNVFSLGTTDNRFQLNGGTPVTVTGSGVQNFITRFNAPTSVETSSIFSSNDETRIIHDNDTNVIFTISGSNGELFTVTDDNSGNLLEVNDASGIDVFSVDAAGNVTASGEVSASGFNISNNITASFITGSFTGSALLVSASIGHLETIYETASVIYSSGSTKFGDDTSDTHEITGSLLVSGAAQFVDILGDANEIVIVGANNSLTSSNLLSIDTTNERIGIGTSTPEVKLDLVGETSGEAQVRIAQHDNSTDGPDMRFFKSRGTAASPNAVNDNDYVGAVNAFVYDGSNYQQGGFFGFQAEGTDGDTTFGLRTRVGGTLSDRIAVDAAGDVSIPGNLDIESNVTGSSITGSFTGSILGDVIGTASIADNATTSSHTTGTASIADSAVTSSYINHLEQNVSITGSVDVSGSVTAHSFNISSTATGTPTIYSDSNINLSASNAVVVTSSPLRLASFTNAETGSITAQIGDIIYNSDTADYKLYSGSWLTILNETSTASLATTASHTAGTASIANNAVTASHTAGTASFANTATTSSYASTGDGVFSGSFSGSFDGINPFPFTGSGEMQGTLTVHSDNDYIDDYVDSYFAGTAINSDGDMTITGSIFSPYINADGFTGSLSGSFTGSFGGSIDSASLAETASYFNGTVTSASFAETASHVVTASFADMTTTASYGFDMTASSLRVEGTASIVYLESVYETASVIYSSGSTKFGDDTSDNHERTGSVDISGSLTVEGSASLVASQSVNNNTASGSLSFWQGSQAEYNLISASADNNTIYFVV